MDMREVMKKEKITKDDLPKALRASAEALYYITNLLEEESPPRRLLVKTLEHISDFRFIWDPKTNKLVPMEEAPLELLLVHTLDVFSFYFTHLSGMFEEQEDGA